MSLGLKSLLMSDNTTYDSVLEETNGVFDLSLQQAIYPSSLREVNPFCKSAKMIYSLPIVERKKLLSQGLLDLKKQRSF